MNRIVCSMFVLFFALTLPLAAKTYLPLNEALKQSLPAGDKVFRKSLVLDANQASFINRSWNDALKVGDKITVYFTRNAQNKVTGYAVELVDTLRQYADSNHHWVIGFTAEKKLTGVRICELTDSYAFPLANPKFLGQFNGKNPVALKVGKNIDAVAGATESTVLLVNATKKAVFVLSQMKFD